MLIIPAIDIKEGKCIRLLQGQPGTESVYSDDPVAMARRWESEGARLIHVVDIDGAFTGKPLNHELVVQIIRSIKIPVQVSGGIRTTENIDYYIKNGASTLVLGTKVVSNVQFLKKACDAFPGRISVGLDTREDMVLVQGWTQTTPQSAIELAGRFSDFDIRSIIFTDVQRDGMLSGPNLDAIRKLTRAVRIPIIASGGISSLNDIRSLLPLEPFGVSGMIIGKALYTGAVKLSEALSVAGGHP